MSHGRRWLAATLAANLMVLAGTANSAPAAAGDATPSTVVMAHEFMFAPASLTIPAGATVTWTNKDEEPHTIVSESGLFRSGAIDTNESFSFKFEKPGTYHYACSIHPRMIGTIIVR
jgi:plastocyanin